MSEKENKLLKWYNRLCDLTEVYLPCAIFLFMFISYIVLIVYRYVVKASFDWLYELNTLSFVWCGIFAASHGSRTDNHVKFSILYDCVSQKVQQAMRIVGDIFVVVTFSIMFPRSIDNLAFMAVRKSSILKIPYNYVFFPFMVFMGLTILHHTILLIKDIMSLFKKEGGNS